MATQPDEFVSPPEDPRTVVEIEGRYYILATSSPADENAGVLKHGDSFAVFDRFGDIRPIGLGEEGLYHRGTRFLSALGLRIAGERPLLLGSTARGDNSRLAIDLTNPDVMVGDRMLRTSTIHVSRTKVLWAAACHERIELRNFGEEPVTLPLSLRFAADYVDLFEVRGMQRARRGSLRAPRISKGSALLGYDGLDGLRRHTRITFTPAPAELDAREAKYLVELEPGRSATIEFRVACEFERPARATDYATALDLSGRELGGRIARSARITSSSDDFNDWVGRSLSDVVMMTSETAHGPYPYAGIPWFSTVFGRDGLITALQLLWVQPALARGVLGHLAANQATVDEPERDAQPGKILHEVRHGEMAARMEVPFARYYGSHDATPLFVILADAYYRQTADRAFIEQLWPNVERALAWIDGPADPDGDGFIEYARRSPTGLAHQGWKDSNDAVFHADGVLAEGPIALCELQAYVYAARLGAANLADALGHDGRASELRTQALALQRALRGGLLGRGAGHVRHRARRRQAALPRPDLEPRTLPLRRHREPGARRAGGGRAVERCDVLRLGRPHAGRRRAPIQPDVLPRRLHLAARQRDHRPGAGTRRIPRPRRARARTGSSRRAVTSSWRGCPSSSAASAAARGRGRRATRSPAHRRHGRPARCSCCSRHASAWRSTPPPGCCASTTPACRPSSITCASTTLPWAMRP